MKVELKRDDGRTWKEEKWRPSCYREGLCLGSIPFWYYARQALVFAEDSCNLYPTLSALNSVRVSWDDGQNMRKVQFFKSPILNLWRKNKLLDVKGFFDIFHPNKSITQQWEKKDIELKIYLFFCRPPSSSNYLKMRRPSDHICCSHYWLESLRQSTLMKFWIFFIAKEDNSADYVLPSVHSAPIYLASLIS